MASNHKVPVNVVIMRILFALIFGNLVFGTISISAKHHDRVEIQIGHEKRVANNSIRLKFVDLIEDSRCPVDTQCVWAGNAKIKISLSHAGRRAKLFEINTGIKPQTIVFAGYEIKIADLTPHPASNIRIRKDGYVATFSILRKR